MTPTGGGENPGMDHTSPAMADPLAGAMIERMYDLLDSRGHSPRGVLGTGGQTKENAPPGL